MKKLDVIIGCIVFVILFAMFSCGARKVNKESSKEEIKTEAIDNSVIEKQSESNVKQTSTIKVDDKNETITEETITEPADNTKESFVIEKDGTKVILNNVKKIVRKTTQKNNVKTDKIENSEINQNSVSKEQKAVKHTNTSVKKENSKQVDKKQFNPLNLILISFGVLVLLYAIYRVYKKFMLP